MSALAEITDPDEVACSSVSLTPTVPLRNRHEVRPLARPGDASFEEVEDRAVVKRFG